MEWIKRLNQAVLYIEEHLTEEIDYEELAKIACCSTYHLSGSYNDCRICILIDHRLRRCFLHTQCFLPQKSLF